MDATHLYPPVIPQRVIDITALYTVHYFENHKNYYFTGEKHNFWEIMYVDSGELILDSDMEDGPIHLQQGELFLFRPNEFHRTYSNNISDHKMMVVSFQCHSPVMEFFLNHNRFRINDAMRQQMGILLQEARKSYTNHSVVSSSTPIQRQENGDLGSEQILVMMVEWLLIQLIRNDHVTEPDSFRSAPNYVDNAVSYIKQNLRSKISIEDICSHVGISRSQLQKAFQQQMGISVMRYLVQQRMEEIKFLICNGDKSFTQISEEFGYSSVHHFSTQFRKTVGMSPTQYAESILAAARNRSIPGTDIPVPPTLLKQPE